MGERELLGTPEAILAEPPNLKVKRKIFTFKFCTNPPPHPLWGGASLASFFVWGGGGILVSSAQFVLNLLTLRSLPSSFNMTTMAIRRIRPFRTFEDLPGELQQFYYGDSPLRTQIPGRVVRNLRTLVGLSLSRLRVNMTSMAYPIDEFSVCQLALDWLQANGSRAYLSTLTQADLDHLTGFPTRGALASARKASLRRIMMIYWKKYTRGAPSPPLLVTIH